MSPFNWNQRNSQAAMLLAEGLKIQEVADAVGVSEKTIDRWKRDIEFSSEVDRLSLMLGIASRAERLRIAKRIARQLGDMTEKDLLDWLKFAQSETDGVKLDLAALVEAAASVADSGSGGSDPRGVAPPTEIAKQLRDSDNSTT